MIGIFNKEEKNITDAFEKKFGKEIEVYNNLLSVYSAFIQATSGKVKDTDLPNWTILILLSQTLSLMENAIKLLASGYLRSPEIMIRVAGEAAILSVYFKEFPETEREYEKLDYREFFRIHKIDKMLKRVEREGKIFIHSEANKKIKWHKIMFTNLFKESSRFLHNNPNVIYDLTVDQLNSDKDRHRLIMGPQLYPDEALSMALRRLFNTLLFSLVVLGVSLNIMPDDNERKIMDESSKIIEELNIKK